MDFFSVGTVAIVSQHYGAGELEQASRKAKEIFKFAILFSIILCALGMIFSGKVIGLLNLEPEVERLGRTYVLIIFMAIPSLFLGEAVSSIFRAIGDTTTPMIIMITAVGSNIILDILLIYGVWIFPRLEVAGAAIATSIAHTIATILALIFVSRGKIPFEVFPKPSLALDWKVIRQIFKIGFPISMASVMFSVVYLVITRIMSEFGTSAVASIPVGNRAESISFMTCFGFYLATSAMVGQNLGANKPERAEKAAWASAGIVTLITGFYGLIFYLFSEQIPAIFTQEPEVIKNAAMYLKILALSQIFMGYEIVLEGAFSGAGFTLPPMLISIPGTLLRIPIAYYLAITLGMGPVGIFWAITISTIIKGIAIVIWFKAGTWKRKVI